MLAGVNPGPCQSPAEVSSHLLKCPFVLHSSMETTKISVGDIYLFMCILLCRVGVVVAAHMFA